MNTTETAEDRATLTTVSLFKGLAKKLQLRLSLELFIKMKECLQTMQS